MRRNSERDPPNRRYRVITLKWHYSPNRSKMRVCVISGVIKDSKVLQALSAAFAQACEFYVCNAEWFTPVPGLGPELCHDRGLALPHPWDWVGVTVALGVSSVVVSGLACGRCMRAPLGPISPSTDTRVVSVVLRVKVLRSTHNCPPRSEHQIASKKKKNQVVVCGVPKPPMTSRDLVDRSTTT